MEINWTTVLLVVLGFALLYFGWRFITTGRFTQREALDLKTAVPPVTAIANPGSSVYTYSMWVYVNTWSTGTKTIFCAGPPDNPDCALTLDSTSPILRCTLKGSGATGQNIEITDNFPITKWVHIAIMVNVNVVDCYLNGKMVRTVQLPTVPPMPTFTSINFGTFDCNIVGFKRIASTTDSNSIWKDYLAGNGHTSTGPMLNIPSYGLSIGITKDGVSDRNFTLF